MDDNHRSVLIKSYRYTIDDWCFEIPTETIGDSPELSLEEIAKKELLEEAGYKSEKIIKLGNYYASNGVMNDKINYFLAPNVEINEKLLTEELENISEVLVLSIDKVKELIFSSKMKDIESAFGVLLAIQHINQNNH